MLPSQTAAAIPERLLMSVCCTGDGLTTCSPCICFDSVATAYCCCVYNETFSKFIFAHMSLYNNLKITEWIFMKSLIAHATFEVLMMVTMKFTVFCDMMP